MLKQLLKISLALLLLVGAAPANAQRNCGAMEHLQNMILEDPSVLQNRQNIEQFTQNWITNNPQGNNSRALVTIPVVVHVVYRTTTENISDAQIQSQMNVLNADFAKLNADWTNTPSVFQSLVANVDVQFCLAQRDPNGNASNGIVRKLTTSTSFSTNDNVKRSANGGSDAWPSSSYLNLWVCNISGGILGYAQFPGGSAATDGVVVNYNAFGTIGTAAAPFNKGRTATHEVGHWLNLYHIWGDDGTGCTGSDNVTDTPNQGDENYGCPSFPTVSCSNGPNGDMYMNYMDYTDDACMFMFTNGQKVRMQALFAAGGFRASLLNSLGCVPGNITACNSPTGLSASNVTTTGATLTWSAVSGATSYNVQYKTSAAATFTTVSTSATSFTLSGLANNTTYNYQVQTVCSSGSSSYTTTGSFTTLAVTTTCTDAYESNNSISTAKTIPVNTAITALIGTSTDNDYFKFANTSTQRRIRITLTNLPANYNVILYNSKSRQVAISQNTGTANETITFNTTTVGTYYIRVLGSGGAFNASNCYTLTASLSATNFRLADDATDAADLDLTNDKPSVFDLTLAPNPSNGNLNISIFTTESMENANVQVFDLAGRVVFEQALGNVEAEFNTGLDLSALENGFYFVAIKNNSQVKQIQKIMIAK